MTHDAQIDFYLEPVRKAYAMAAWRFECDMIDRVNANGYTPPLEKPTFEAFERAGESSISGQKMAPAHRVDTGVAHLK